MKPSESFVLILNAKRLYLQASKKIQVCFVSVYTLLLAGWLWKMSHIWSRFRKCDKIVNNGGKIISKFQEEFTYVVYVFQYAPILYTLKYTLDPAGIYLKQGAKYVQS